MTEDFWNSKAIKVRFKLLNKLGQGGKGEVYKVLDNYLKKEMAIKIIKGEVSDTQAVRLQKEAIAAGKLNHENILEVYDFGLAEGNTPYLVMAYVDGISLSGLLKDVGTLKSEDAVFLFIQLARGMKHAHGNGVLHRDLKPSNVMIAEDIERNRTTVKILDFGLARLKDAEEKSLTQSGEGVGSPYYMSPEQAAGGEIDERADIYSMGCLMYEVLTGRPPFLGETVLETTIMHKTEKPMSINELLSQVEGDLPVEQVPEELDELVLSCLAKNKEARPESFKLLEGKLVPILDKFTKVEKDASAYRVSSREVPVPRGVKLAISFLLALLSLGALTTVLYQKFPLISEPPRKDRAFRMELTTPTPAIVKWREDEDKLVLECKMPVTDKELRVIARDESVVAEKYLHRLKFTNGIFSGAGFDAFKDVEVKELYFNDCDITDEGIKYISQIKGLHYLTISKCPRLTDEFAENLKGASVLWVLQVDCPQLTEEFIKPVKEMDSIHRVYPPSIKLTAKIL